MAGKNLTDTSVGAMQGLFSGFRVVFFGLCREDDYIRIPVRFDGCTYRMCRKTHYTALVCCHLIQIDIFVVVHRYLSTGEIPMTNAMRLLFK